MNRWTFLTAHWRHLVMLNYRIDPDILRPDVPPGVELDVENGETFVSLVGFHFGNTRVLGIPVPGHRNFEEFNLRFYVRCVRDEVRRGVTFIKEIVPKRAIAWLANVAYNERYVAMPMRHRDTIGSAGGEVEYCWNTKGRWNHLRAVVGGEPSPLVPGSHEQFIAEHYWGYTEQRDGGTVEYQVRHPSWRIWPIEEFDLACDVRSLYGDRFAAALSAEPVSAFVAEGSDVSVSMPRRLV